MTAEATTLECSERNVPPVLRCCGYLPRGEERWVGYCLELDIRVEGRDWDELLERFILSATLQLNALLRNGGYSRRHRAPLSVRICYMYIALLHFIRPHGPRRLADLSSALLLAGPP